MPRPLTKLDKNGVPYRRRPPVDAAIEACLAKGRVDVLVQAAIADRNHPDYLPSEVLAHLVRQSRQDNSDRQFEQLFKLLMARVAGSLRGSVRDNQLANAEELRQGIMSELALLLAADRANTTPELDVYEVVFDKALMALRVGYLRRHGPAQNRTEPLEDPDTGTLSAEVEAAAERFLAAMPSFLDDSRFRSRLVDAIDGLPDDQRQVIGLLLQGLPIDAKEEGAASIARLLNCNERTVRNRRDRAYQTLRTALGEEYQQ